MSIIKYRYPGEDWVEIEGDSYNFETTEETCQGSNVSQNPTILLSAEHNDGNIIYKNAPREVAGDIGSVYSGINLTPDIIEINFTYIERKGTYTSYLDINKENSTWVRPKWTGAILGSFKYYIWWKNRDGSWRYGGQLDPNASWASRYCTPKQCIFKVFFGEEVVFSRTSLTCPEVEEASRCPEGTCEVTCGDTICCYGSDGISVANFPRS